MLRQYMGFQIALAAVLGALGCSHNSDTGPCSPTGDCGKPALSTAISGITVEGADVVGIFVDAPVPTGGAGTAPAVQGPSTPFNGGATVPITVSSANPIDTLYVTATGTRGYYALPLSGVNSAESRTLGRVHADQLAVQYNLQIILTTGVKDSFSIGVLSLVGTILSLESGFTICIGSCTPPPAPDVTGNWTWVYSVDGMQLSVPLAFTNYTPHPDASASFTVVDLEGGSPGTAIGAGSIAANGLFSMEADINGDPCNGDGAGTEGLAVEGTYVKSSANNGGDPEITGYLGLVGCIGGAKTIQIDSTSTTILVKG